jgi:CheY-like chemotaxis protein
MTKVLIVEDDPLLSRMYQRVFTFEGLEVKFAENGKVGLELLQSFVPQIILIDIMMPVMNGVEMLTALKSNPTTKDIPVLMLSNLADAQTAQETMAKGALDYVIKSQYGPAEISTMVKDILNKGNVAGNTNEN